MSRLLVSLCVSRCNRRSEQIVRDIIICVLHCNYDTELSSILLQYSSLEVCSLGLEVEFSAMLRKSLIELLLVILSSASSSTVRPENRISPNNAVRV